MKTITRTFHARVREDGRLLLSSEDPVDQDGYILDSRGWDLSRWADRSMKMSYNHATYGPNDFPIGRWEKLEAVEGDGLVGAPVFAADEYERAAIAAKLRAGGFLDDLSVQFGVDHAACREEVVGGKRYLRSMRHWPLEVGFVFVGADPRAGEPRMSEAVSRGVITEEEARGFEPPADPPAPDPIIALTDQVASLRAELESSREQIDRLTADIAELRERDAHADTGSQPDPDPDPPPVPVVLRIVESEEARVRVDPDHITAAVQRTIGQYVGAAIKHALNLASGRLPD